MTCKLCEKRGQTWIGSAPACYFDSPDRNWNCATVNAIRDIVYEGQELKDGVHYEYCDDEKFATINIHEITDDKENHIGRCLYVAWYKQRGSTEALWILDGEDDVPRKPTEAELIAIIKQYARSK